MKYLTLLILLIASLRPSLIHGSGAPATSSDLRPSPLDIGICYRNPSRVPVIKDFHSVLTTPSGNALILLVRSHGNPLEIPFDGYKSTAQWVLHNLPTYILEDYDKTKNWKSALSRGFDHTETKLPSRLASKTAASAMVAVIDKRQIIIANLGNCQAGIVTHNDLNRIRSLPLSKPHLSKKKPTEEGPVSSITHGFGGRTIPLSKEPDITTYDRRHHADLSVVLGTRGLWRMIGDQKLFHLYSPAGGAKSASRQLINKLDNPFYKDKKSKEHDDALAITVGLRK